MSTGGAYGDEDAWDPFTYTGTNGETFAHRQAYGYRDPAEIRRFVQNIDTVVRPRPYYFPAQLPIVLLTEEQQKENYGLTKANVAPELLAEVKAFKEWCAAPINTARTAAYASPNSTATLEKVGKSARAYLGFTAKLFGVPVGRLSLHEYADPVRLMHFVAYLKARHTKVGHILNHLSIARKVNVYLGSLAEPASQAKAHANEIDTWIATLITQVYQTEPQNVKTNVVEATKLWGWADRLAAEAMAGIAADMKHIGTLTLDVALRVQDAAVASLVVGRDMPPCRLDFIKHLVHPRHNGDAPCRDPDCRDPSVCPGNTIAMRERSQVRVGDCPTSSH